jgi:uncharacterized metal-binding protein YceD (DUF177 family)
VDKPHFVVPIADLGGGPRRLHWEISDGWLRWALTDTDATPRNGPGELDVELSMNGQQVIVRGSASVGVSMPCVRTLDPVDLDLKPEIFLMLEPGPKAEPRRRRDGERERQRPDRPAKSPAKGPAKKKGPAWRETPELPEEIAAQDRYDGEEVVLDQFVREFILLELPMSPMRTTLPNEPEPARSDAPLPSAGEPAVDPRLLPLLAIKNRLKNPKE